MVVDRDVDGRGRGLFEGSVTTFTVGTEEYNETPQSV
jgi:hypothetical protein